MGEDIKKRRRVSPITLRILAVNVLALAILLAGLLFLGQYRNSLIQAELSALELQAEMFAAVIGEVSVVSDEQRGQELAAEVARRIVRRIVETTDTRARLYRPDGTMIAFSSESSTSRVSIICCTSVSAISVLESVAAPAALAASPSGQSGTPFSSLCSGSSLRQAVTIVART